MGKGPAGTKLMMPLWAGQCPAAISMARMRGARAECPALAGVRAHGARRFVVPILGLIAALGGGTVMRRDLNGESRLDLSATGTDQVR